VADRDPGYERGRADGLREAAQFAREHGAVYFAEPRPCRCKPTCGLITAARMPFADVLLNLEGASDGS
jgi:hypothetical protein